MTTQEALDYYDNNPMRMAQALGVWVSAIYQWGEYPPIGRQFQLEVLSEGKLKAERNDNDTAK